MNRRTSLSTLIGRSSKGKKNKPRSFDRTINSIDEYIGDWDFKRAAHLLRRSMYGPTYDQIQASVEDGLQATIAQLLTPTPMPEPPINYYYEDEPGIPIGETWVNTPLNVEHRVHRKKSLEGWTVKQVMEEGVSITEKMTLFWHNHFVTADFPLNTRYKHNYITTIRENALGNFRTLTKAMTIDPYMLLYLNGNSNTKTAPNENYARELLELFTVGKGPLIGPGDYSNYTEADIAEIARILTGWKQQNVNNQGAYSLSSYFIPNNHDTGDKQLSYHFGNAAISNADENEYSNLIDLIFEQEEVARFICRKLYRWFVHYEIDEDVELNVIEPLAQVMRDNDYEISPVLQSLFTSQHFYEEDRIGCMIKNPWDFSISILKQLNVVLPDDPAIYYETYRVIFQGMVGLQMEYYNPPNVSGWKPYYQAPTYYRIWLNSATLQIRSFAVSTFSTFGVPLFVDPGVNQGFLDINYLELLNNMSDPFDINIVIQDFVKLLLPKEISESQKSILKNILISDLPDFEWNVEYSDYISNPSNETQANAVRNKIKNLVAYIFNMPEYQLM